MSRRSPAHLCAAALLGCLALGVGFGSPSPPQTGARGWGKGDGLHCARAQHTHALWHGLPTVPPGLTEGLPEAPEAGDLRSADVARSGDRATTGSVSPVCGEVAGKAPRLRRPAALVLTDDGKSLLVANRR